VLQRVKKSNSRSEIELRMSTILKFKYMRYHVMSRKFRLVIIEIFAKNHAFQNLMYLAIISVLNQPVVHIRYQR